MPYRNYPLTTPEGVPIPIDLLEPLDALDPISISASPMGAPIAIPNNDIRLLEVWATTDCILGFTSSAVDGGSTKGTYHLRADDPRLIIASDAYISALSTGDSGTLYVNLLNLWEAAKKDYQTDTGE